MVNKIYYCFNLSGEKLHVIYRSLLTKPFLTVEFYKKITRRANLGLV